MPEYPIMRMRRLRKTKALRDLVRESDVNAGDLIYPLFVCSGTSRRTPVPEQTNNG